MVGPAGVTDPLGTNFIDKITERWIWIHIDPAAESDPDFGGVVASENVSVLDKGYFKTKSCRSECGTYAGDSGPYYDKVEMAFFLLSILSEKPSSKFFVFSL